MNHLCVLYHFYIKRSRRFLKNVNKMNKKSTVFDFWAILCLQKLLSLQHRLSLSRYMPFSVLCFPSTYVLLFNKQFFYYIISYHDHYFCWAIFVKFCFFIHCSGWIPTQHKTCREILVPMKAIPSPDFIIVLFTNKCHLCCRYSCAFLCNRQIT